MPQPPKKKSNVVPIVILVIILGVIGYFYISNRNSNELLLQVQTKDSSEIIGKDLLAALSRLNAIKLDDKLFRDPMFNSLQDFSVEIVAQPVGRDNPFLPIGSTGTSTSGTSLKKALPKKR